ncbi:MAG: hypothetical protein HFJ17_03980 [Clostridia bacterium]|nr:hypothetical protein [Clostridia bacterium]
MDFKNNKGFVGVDASIGILILIIIIPIMTGIIYNISRTNSEISRKNKAINIAINKIEEAKLSQASLEEIAEEKDGTYKVKVDVQDYADTDEGKNRVPPAKENIVKIVKVTVEYRVGKENREVTLSTLAS